jgi:hypothetical protein
MIPAAAATLPTNVRRDRRVEESFSSFIVISPNSGAWFRHGPQTVSGRYYSLKAPDVQGK